MEQDKRLKIEKIEEYRSLARTEKELGILTTVLLGFFSLMTVSNVVLGASSSDLVDKIFAYALATGTAVVDVILLKELIESIRAKISLNADIKQLEEELKSLEIEEGKGMRI